MSTFDGGKGQWRGSEICKDPVEIRDRPWFDPMSSSTTNAISTAAMFSNKPEAHARAEWRQIAA